MYKKILLLIIIWGGFSAFLIKETEPFIKITSYNSWRVVEQATPLQLTWVSEGMPSIQEVDIYLVAQKTGESTHIKRVTNTGSTNIQVSDRFLGEYRIKISTAGKTAIMDENNSAIWFVNKVLKSGVKEKAYYAGLHRSVNKVASHSAGGMLYFKTANKHNKVSTGVLKLYDTSVKKYYYLGVEEVYGQNFFQLDLESEMLKSQGFSPQKDRIYYLEINRAIGYDNQILKFRYYDSPDVESDIIPAIHYVNCDVSNATEVEYFPSVKEGTAPYTIEWFVSNSPNKEDAWMKRSGTIKGKEFKKSKSFGDVNPLGTSITVAADLGYFVILDVTDGCGKQSEKVVRVLCQKAKKSKNALNVQLIDVETPPTK